VFVGQSGLSPWPSHGFAFLELKMHSAAQDKRRPMKLPTADKVTLGFIGLGNMGSRIAQRLLDHGYSLVAYDRDTAKD
jgi:phosphoglycerate dehydrogenase-like enzyme